eukprot:TRINITY_DN16904_c0_g1_i1.p1 TRINITY_DN16904_c0_g1~~TRINITY_DN16904_c0_g1_i1.p1  ORF type:complete len:137 (-),score=37.69 TRINITY_DN16904_c0_g1_i1:27-437(-)
MSAMSVPFSTKCCCEETAQQTPRPVEPKRVVSVGEYALNTFLGVLVPAGANVCASKPLFYKPWLHVIFGVGCGYLFSSIDWSIPNAEKDAIIETVRRRQESRNKDLAWEAEQYQQLKTAQNAVVLEKMSKEEDHHH